MVSNHFHETIIHGEFNVPLFPVMPRRKNPVPDTGAPAMNSMALQARGAERTGVSGPLWTVHGRKKE